MASSSFNHRTQLLTGEYSDLILRCPGQVDIKVHRIIVNVASDVIRKRSQEASVSTSEEGISVINLPDIDADSLSRVLEHVYTGFYPCTGQSIHVGLKSEASRGRTGNESKNGTTGSPPEEKTPSTAESTIKGDSTTGSPPEQMTTLKRKRADSGDEAQELLQHIKVYLCARKLNIQCTAEAAINPILEYFTTLLSLSDRVSSLAAPLKMLLEGTNRDDSVRQQILSRCLLRHMTCNFDGAIADTLLTHERSIWTVAMPLLESLGKTALWTCHKCSAVVTVQMKPGSSIEIQCTECASQEDPAAISASGAKCTNQGGSAVTSALFSGAAIFGQKSPFSFAQPATPVPAYKSPFIFDQPAATVPAPALALESTPIVQQKQFGFNYKTALPRTEPFPAFSFGQTATTANTSNAFASKTTTGAAQKPSFSFGQAATPGTASKPPSGFEFGAPAVPTMPAIPATPGRLTRSSQQNFNFNFGESVPRAPFPQSDPSSSSPVSKDSKSGNTLAKQRQAGRPADVTG